MKKILSMAVLGMLAMCANAQQISKDDAASKARSFWASPSKDGRRKAMAVGTPQLSYTAEKGGKAQFYVFNNSASEGFVIIGGDEQAQEILGYSYEGTFDYANAPENVKWWLSQYQEQIYKATTTSANALTNTTFGSSNTAVTPNRAAASTRQTVENLISTKWNQDAPYNKAIPNLPGFSGNNAFATGCVATAMAQVMKKYEWPDTTGLGKNEYQRIYNNNSDTIVFSADFANTHYAWENMKDSYTSYENADEVAKLMYHAGVSVNMEYGQISVGGSGAFASSIAPALVNNFSYDKGASYHYHNHYTNSEWEDMIYSELVAGRPVIYSGQSKSGGHTFICHGYNAESNKYAINWGWGGMYDGLFSLTSLKPNGTGIGGGSAGYPFDQDQEVLIGIRPDVGGDYFWQLMASDDADKQCLMKLGNGEYTNHIDLDMSDDNNANAKITINGSAFNQSMVPFSFEIGLLFVDNNTRQSKIVGNVARLSDVPYKRGVLFSKEVFASIFECNGEYSVYPIFRLDTCTSVADWKRVNVPLSFKTPTLSISGLKDPEHIDVELRMAASAVQEGKQTTITHSPNYTGRITYTATPSNIVSVSSTGVVTGLNEGMATITVNCPAQGYYNETVREFEITVTKTPVVPVKMEISGTTVTKGERLTITHDPEYHGTITYSADPENIVSIDENGVVTALAAGTVRITAIADSIRFYTRTVEYFDVTVNSVPEDVYLVSVNIPNNGYFTYEGVKANAIYRNNTGKNYSAYPTYCTLFSVDLNQLLVYGGLNMRNFYDGHDIDYTYNVRSNNLLTVYNMGLHNFKLRFTSDPQGTKLLEPTDIAEQPLTLVDRIEVNLQVGESGWGTLTLPFEGELSESQMNSLEIYSCSEVVDNVLQLTPVTSGKLKMDTPYIIKGQPGKYTFAGPEIPNKNDAYSSGVLTGLLKKDSVAAEAYVLGVREYEGLGMVPAFYRVDAENIPELDANQAYVLLPTSGNISDALFFDKETADAAGIEVITVPAVASHRGIYTISGQLVGRDKQDLRSGIYIIDGEKVMK